MTGDNNWTELRSADEPFKVYSGGEWEGKWTKMEMMMAGGDKWSDIGYPDVGGTG